MDTILPLLVCLDAGVTPTASRQLRHILLAMLTMTGRVTMRGMARWTGKGGSYRTIQRFFATTLPWASLFWLFFRTHCFAPDDVYLLAGDETVVTKAGKHTHGLDRFFSSIYGRAVPGLAFFALSVVSRRDRHAFPLCVEQVLRPPVDPAHTASPRRSTTATKKPTAPVSDAPPTKRGRPKGCKTTDKRDVVLSAELQRISTMVTGLLQRISQTLPLTYLVLDGHVGNNDSVQMTQRCGLHLISKVRADSALYTQYAGPYAGHGPRRRYGEKLIYKALPDQYLHTTTVEDGIETRIHHLTALHKDFADPLNVVIITKINLQSRKVAHVILFSSDVTLSSATIIDYYSLRFQIEFNFRDAKQYWGLEDFMNVSQTAVTNAANISLFMVNVTYCYLQKMRHRFPEWTPLDLKTQARGIKYVEEVVNCFPKSPTQFYWAVSCTR